MKLLSEICSKSILVIGDIMIDYYYSGDISRISPEAPVPIFRKKGERCVLGGAANVAANLIAANQQVSIMSIIGHDSEGELLHSLLADMGINTDLLIKLNRRTTIKTRFLAGNNQQVLRMDVEDTTPISSSESNLLLQKLKRYIQSFDLILISDYMKGLLSHEFTQGVISCAQEQNIPVIIDVKDPQKEKYKNATLLKPNLKELHDLTGIAASTDEEIISASQQLRKICQCKYVLTTCGPRGMVLVGENTPYFINSVVKEVFDVSGAGDTTIAYLATCMANGIEMKYSVDIANLAASIQVGKIGTSCVYLQEVAEQCKKDCSRNDKIINLSFATQMRSLFKDKKIVFTNGCFDILHIGHIRYLQEAAKLGDILVVGVNSDSSVKRLKGLQRPINTEKDRADMLCAMDFIDYVIIFNDDTPLSLIETIQPNILVKGGDYAPKDVIGREFVESHGGSLKLIPFVEGHSTTSIISKISQENN